MTTRVRWIKKSFEQLQDESRGHAQTSGKKFWPDENTKWNYRYFDKYEDAEKFIKNLNRNNDHFCKLEKEY